MKSKDAKLSTKLHKDPLYAQVAELLREYITSHCQPGEQLDADIRLARRFSVSIPTIREGMGALAHEGLVERHRGRGTFVCDRTVRQHVALWFSRSAALPTPVYADRVLGLTYSFLMKHGIRVQGYQAWSDDRESASGMGADELLADLRQQRISAVGIIQGPLGPGIQELVEEQKIPMVMTHLSVGPDRLVVAHDYAAEVRQGVQHLLERGCRRIALVGWHGGRPERQARTPSYQTFKSVLSEHGLPPREQWIRGDLHPSLAGAGYAAFREIWSAAAEKPDGLLVTDDLLFADVALAITELRLAVPDQLRVVAHANKGAVACPFFPAARLECDPAEHAARLGEMLLKLVRKEPVEPQQVIVPFHWAEPAARGPVLQDNQVVSRVGPTRET